MRYKEILSEMLTSGEFTFGFELEAVYEPEHSSDDDFQGSEDEYHDHVMSQLEPSLRDLKEPLLNIFHNYGLDGKIVNDSSIATDGPGQIGFEFAASPMPFNNKSILSVKKLLTSLSKNKIHTNNSCGFHIHVKYPSMEALDMKWILTVLAFNEEWQQHVTSFNDVDFFDIKYAKKSFFLSIKEDIERKDYDTMKEYMNDEKYRVLRMHPQGTLEWRGPRNFMNNNDYSSIDNFLIHLYQYIQILIRCQSTDNVGGLSRSEFNKIFATPKSGSGINIPKNNFYKGFKLGNYAKRFSENTKREQIIEFINENPWAIRLDFQNAHIQKSGSKWLFTGTVNGGIWDGGDTVIFNDGQFNDGVWKSGEWKYGEWNGGVWKSGKWDFGFIDGEESDTPPNSGQ